MEIKSLLINKPHANRKSSFSQSCFKINCQNLRPLKFDTLSFSGNLKKTDFKGLDRAVIETYKINPQQLKTKDDLQKIAQAKVEEIKEKDYGGRSEETKIQRKAMLKEWFEYVTQENDAYSNTQQLIILSGITKELKENNNTIPPVLNKGVLADVIYELEEELKINPSKKFDFNKIYQNKIRSNYLEDSTTGETMTGWVVIPSRANEPENFEKNVEKLKALSHKNWCTKSFNAEPYLSEGDFHVYLEDGQPKLGVRFVDDEIMEIQGEKNNSQIPVNYLDIFMAHQKKHRLKLHCIAKEEVNEAKKVQVKVKEIQKVLGSAIELKTVDDAIKVFNYFGIETEKNAEQNKLIISFYEQPTRYCFSDIGINENKLFSYISRINRFANFANSLITNLGDLESIGENAEFMDSQVISLGKLKTIGRSAIFRYSHVIDLGDLKEIGGNAYFQDSKITNLGNLEVIGGGVDFEDSQITNLGNLKSIGDDALFNYSKITNLGNLKSICGDVFIAESGLSEKDFANIKIGGSLHLCGF